MDARGHLDAGQTAAREGRYEDALREYVWFHNHALEENEALRGVRLSYALLYWTELGALYPEALRQLEAIRDQKSTKLIAGEGGAGLFRDVAAINESFGATEQTWRLYQQLDELQPELAKACAQAALPSIVAARDYRLARKIMPPPEARIRRLTHSMNRDVADIKNEPFTRAPKRWAYIGIYAESVREILLVLNGTGDAAEACRLEALALQLIPDPSVRRDARAGFVKRRNPPRYRR